MGWALAQHGLRSRLGIASSLRRARKGSLSSLASIGSGFWRYSPAEGGDCRREQLDAHGIQYQLVETIEEVVSELDILYMTRVQKERFEETEFQHLKSKYKLDASMLEGAKPNLKVLHPLPRIDEIATDVDATPYAYYFQQAQNGVFARQALLALVLNETL